MRERKKEGARQGGKFSDARYRSAARSGVNPLCSSVVLVRDSIDKSTRPFIRRNERKTGRKANEKNADVENAKEGSHSATPTRSVFRCILAGTRASTKGPRRGEIERLYPICPAIAALPRTRARAHSRLRPSRLGHAMSRGRPGKPRVDGEAMCGRGGKGNRGRGVRGGAGEGGRERASGTDKLKEICTALLAVDTWD